MSDSSRQNPVTEPESADVESPSESFDWRTFDPLMLPGGPDAPLAAELITYRDRLDGMLADHAGAFVIIHGGRVVGYHPSRQAALEAAFREFAREPVLIKQVVEKEPVRRASAVVGFR